MNSPSALTREMLETVFAPDELVTVPAGNVGVVVDSDAREVLRTVGLPVWENPWFDMDPEIAERFECVGDREDPPADRYSVVPPGADRWISIGMIPYDDIAFDPETGTVYCLPDDSEIYVWNSSLRSFVHFLYILQAERPHFDVEWAGDAEPPFDPEGARARTLKAMTSVDPAALKNPRSRWHSVLTYITDPEHHLR
ncbi:SUKH-4 family immunity protein [Nocardia sp. NPDC052254]|uniref:SUKH-4 family immunity protein n=1 Tax=Nocardia sp. NPDC052254 TaxID=3155681 RepID=UPI003417CA84